MKKLILIIIFLSVSLNAFENLKSVSQLKEHDIVFLTFVKNGCPWCVQYKSELEAGVIEKYKDNIKFFKVEKGSEIFSQLRRKFKYKIIIYPMTYILKLDNNKEPKTVYEIYGYQTNEYLEEVFQNELLVK